MSEQQHTIDALATWPDVIMDTYGTPSLSLTHGSGSKVYDADGKEYIDLLAGIAVNSLGHAHPDIITAVSEQVSKLGHVSNLFAHQPVVEVAQELITRFSNGDQEVAGQTRVFFCNSGGEANEAAFKIARLTGKHRILAAVHGFHGRTMGSLALTGQPDKQKPFAPLPTGVEFYPYGDVEYLQKLVEANPTDVAAIFLEPIQGETGVVPAPEGFLKDVRDICDKHEILFVCDEVQTGIGRTGDFFAHQHEGVLPDVVTMAKGLGGGLPIGATLATGKAAQLMTPGKHGTTFGGNPVSCAAAKAVLKNVDDGFVAEVKKKGETFAAALEQLDAVDHVRGRGLMLGVVLKEPIAKKANAKASEFGLIINAPSDQVIRLTPPLVINSEEIAEAVKRIEKLLASVNEA